MVLLILYLEGLLVVVVVVVVVVVELMVFSLFAYIFIYSIHYRVFTYICCIYELPTLAQYVCI